MPNDPPKHSKKDRVFVDREGHVRTFKEAVNNIGQRKFSVLVYYGVAGIGKTSLRKEFMKYLEEYNKKNQPQDVTWASILQQEIIWTSIDLQLDEHRKKSTFLVTLKNDLQEKFKIDFPAFEIAHAIYWKKANPEIPLRKDNYLLFEGNNASDDIFGIVSQIPYLGIVPYAGRFLLKNLPEYLRTWWTKRGEKELKQLSEKEPLEIEEMLPYFWAWDLNNYLGSTSKPAVLFIDTYEVLRENYTNDVYSLDKWIKEELISRLPKNVLWVIFGREALRWEEINSEWSEYLTQYEVEKLLREYCIEYLVSRKINDKEIQRAIFKGSKGVPYYMELSADIYEKIVENGEKPKNEDFGNNHEEIANRFFRYLSPAEKNTLNVLSIPRFWDYDLFNYLVKEFNTGYPINNYKNLCSFSFIGKDKNSKQQIHQLMQECLQLTQKKKDPDSVKKVHEAICGYYSKKIEKIDIKVITLEHEISLVEAFHHAKKVMELEDLFKWFRYVTIPFNRAAFWKLVLPLEEEMLQLLEAEFGTESIWVADSLDKLAGFYCSMGNYNKALPLYQKSLDIYEINLGPQHPNIASLLNGLALLYFRIGDYNKALPLYQRALIIYENSLGPQHPNFASSLNNLALLYFQMGDYEKALPLYQRALDIREKILDPQHPDIANSLNNLAALYNQMGEYGKALPLYIKALEISENVLGSQHPDISHSLNNLAALYKQMGEYGKALPLFQRALNISEKFLGPQHPDVANSLIGLALLYEKIGHYDKALPLHQRALDICENALGPQHPDVANSLTNLAGLYNQMGDYDKALPIHQRAIDIYENVLSPQHPYVANSLDNLATLYYKMGDYDKALQIHQRVLDIREKALSPQHPEVATTLNNLATLYLHMGDYDKALPLYQRALQIDEQVLNPQHPDILISLDNLALLYCQMSNYDKALLLYQRALDIRKNVLGSEHPDVIISQKHLAELYRHVGSSASLQPDDESLQILPQAVLNQKAKVRDVKKPWWRFW